jgi:hypothetical protein
VTASRFSSIMIVTETTATGLHRGLGRADVVALTVNNIVGAGIFTMPAALAAGAGSWSAPSKWRAATKALADR